MNNEENDMNNTPSTSNEDDYDSNEEDCCFADIGFMFDSAQSTKTRTLQFSPSTKSDSNSDTKNVYTVELECVDDDPGAVQSGHYLWPGAPALAQFLVDIFSTGNNNDDCDTENEELRKILQHIIHPKEEEKEKGEKDTSEISIIELGAGCGLVGLVAMQLFSKPFYSCVCCWTDHDPGTLDRAKQNYDRTKKKIHNMNNDDMNDNNDINTHAFFEDLEWGNKETTTYLLSLLGRKKTTDEIETNDKEQTAAVQRLGYDLVLGSDLIYCKEVVKPLFDTISHLLLCSQGIMIMSQSFVYEQDTEEAIDMACQEYNLERQVISCSLFDCDNNSSKKKDGIRIQVFKLRK